MTSSLKDTPSRRTGSTWRTAPAPAGRTGWRSTSSGSKAPCYWTIGWSESSSAACRGPMTGRDFFTTRTQSRRARVMVRCWRENVFLLHLLLKSSCFHSPSVTDLPAVTVKLCCAVCQVRRRPPTCTRNCTSTC